MTRAHFVTKSRTEVKCDDGTVLPVGSSYYWWKFNFSPVKHASKEAPKPQQLTQSAYDQTIMELETTRDMIELTDLEAGVDALKEEIEALKSECEEKLENMPEALQGSSSSGQLLQERIDSLEGWINDLEGIDLTGDYDEVSVREEVEQEFRDELEQDEENTVDDALADLEDDVTPAVREAAKIGAEAAVAERIKAAMESKRSEIDEAVQAKQDEILEEVLEEIQNTGPG